MKIIKQVTVDIVIFTIQEGVLKVLLIKRAIPPFLGQCAIPGGFVHEDEDLDQAALRELQEESGVTDVYLEQLYSFGDPNRDPRGRVITVAYFALISPDRKLMAVPITSGASGSFEAGTPQSLFDVLSTAQSQAPIYFYQPTADGQRFMVIAANGAVAAAPPISIVVNWQAGLKK